MSSERIQFTLHGIGTELKDRRLAVPIYQRSYAWTPEMVGEFWTDLSDAFSEGAPEYFLGTIVLTRKDSVSAAIIDGQQRLATTAVLLACIRDEYRHRGDDARARIVQQDFLSASDLQTALEVPKLQLNSEDSHFFERRLINGDETVPPTRPSHRLLADAYAYLRLRVQETASAAGSAWATRLLDLVGFLRDQAKCMVLSVPTDADAYLIFETLNDRGADLTIADLLKNYLFSNAGNRLDVVRDGWMQVLGALEISAENKLFTTFLRQYWSSRHEAVRERELYKNVKERVSTPTHVVDFITELQAAATVYAALLSSNHELWEDLGGTVRENVETILRLELEQHRPLLLAALQHFSDKEKKRLLRSLVSWSVRGIIVGGIGGGTAEKAYSRAALKVRRGEIKTTAEIIVELSNIIPTDVEFVERLKTVRLPKAAVARYVLIALERGAKNEKEPEFVPNANEEQVNLEHVLPKRGNARDWSAFTPDERKEFVHRLGNLALLQKGPNGRIGNKPFSDKLPILEKSGFSLTSEIARSQTWNAKAVAARQERLAELALKVWPRQ